MVFEVIEISLNRRGKNGEKKVRMWRGDSERKGDEASGVASDQRR